ncbi:hypothetical protein [Proteiniborus sp. MB09-C3]|uniref:hypothetical protein n=1 Tax=Proteiniborus sp. MB09-C3 TaxID=3050072 RepID=UPI0025556C56|nr:hypothetical protein [Proteiniborus sp. MB09-C3]WIV12556.1 hypothetical protein QO263_02210 [Proteiniborus sp. MB09-C3]
MDKYNQTSDIVSQLVQKIKVEYNPREVAGLRHQYQPYLNRHVLAVFTGTNFGLDESLKELSKARRYGFTFDIAITENGEDIIGIQGIASIKSTLQADMVYTQKDKPIFGEILESVDGIIVPMTTQDTAAKLALGIQDCFVSTLLWQGLWHGKKILVDFENVLEYRGNKSKVPMLQQIMNDYVEKLQNMGVKGIDKKDYLVEMLNVFRDSPMPENTTTHNSQNAVAQENHSSRQVITEKDLIKMRANNNEVTVPMGTIITPLAYDRAKELGIRIIKGH